ncbi:hypothetical protein QR685DRAFT_35095 [Neurospora intermedia]|uniref:Uncharacterized protein n=1 Tax=Neurospora intermedia TaxID=5142 RepID=A0ABR3DRY7_NEUIN
MTVWHMTEYQSLISANKFKTSTAVCLMGWYRAFLNIGPMNGSCWDIERGKSTVVPGDVSFGYGPFVMRGAEKGEHQSIGCHSRALVVIVFGTQMYIPGSPDFCRSPLLPKPSTITINLRQT